jgi:hypothetical protein
LREVIEFASGEMVELSPFVLTGNTCSRMWDVNLVMFWLIVALTGDVDKLENQRPAGDNATASW